MNEATEAKLEKINARIAWMEDAAANGPENLYQDGERSRADVDAEFRALYRERGHLEDSLRPKKIGLDILNQII